MMQGPPQDHLVAFGVMAFLTEALYFAFSWFREQFCIILCPYGRLQAALIDGHSVVIGYDSRRGEPRGKASAAAAGKAGDCVDCRRCVQVCPTGIDIRNGLQLECIGCSACVDACDDIMKKLHRPPGLVRYDSQVGLQGGRTRLLRPRIWLYIVLLCGATPASLHAAGLDRELYMAPLAEEQKPLVLTLPAAAFIGPFPLRVKATDTQRGDSSLTGILEFLGPDPRLKDNEPLNPKTLYNKPWLLVAAGLLSFVAVWVAFIFFAVKHQPPQVDRVVRNLTSVK
ncbi:MAG TPA: 4Fe-4S dicluster domain-containing protein [Prosthecobacter sp.]|nr:4Fe-4S dicluster domain-containing protein [Prosthecobacter sp.]